MPKTYLIAFALMWWSWFPAIAGDVTSATYKLYWKGLIIGESNVSLTQTALEYGLYSNFKTKGILRLFVKGESELNTTGKIGSDGIPTSTSLKTEGIWRGDRYAREVLFDENGKVIKLELIDPDDDGDDDDYIRLPVPADQQVGPEPTSMLITLMSAPWQASEDGKITHVSFNGTQVSLTTLACDKAPQDLPKRKSRVYQGKAIYCTIAVKTLAGGWQENPDKKKKKKTRKTKGKNPLAVWFADVGGDGKYIPVEFSLPSRWGNTVFTMTSHDYKTQSGAVVDKMSGAQ